MQPQLHSMYSAFGGDRPRINRTIGSVLCRVLQRTMRKHKRSDRNRTGGIRDVGDKDS